MLRPQPAASDAVDSADFVRNGNLSALFRSHANDSYLLLASDADQVGKTSQQILENTKLVAGHRAPYISRTILVMTNRGSLCIRITVRWKLHYRQSLRRID